MSENDRKRLLELPIGPDQLHELDTIEKFLTINKFPAINPEKND